MNSFHTPRLPPSEDDLLSSTSSDEKMDTGSESFQSTQDTPNSTLSDSDDRETEVLRLQNPNVLRLSMPEPDGCDRTGLNDSLISRMSTLTLDSPDNRPKNLGISPPRLSSTLTSTTDHPLKGLASPDDNFPDVVPKKAPKIEEDLSLSSIEDERVTNGYEFYSPQRNTSKNNLYFTENFSTADSQLLSASLNVCPDVTRVRRKIVAKLMTPPKSVVKGNLNLNPDTKGECAIKEDKSKVSSQKLCLDVSEPEEFHSAIEWCESPTHVRAVPNFELPIEMSSNIGVNSDLASPDVISSSTQEDKSLYQALLDPYTGSVALRHTPHRNNTPRRKVQPDLASPDVISSSTQEDKSLYQALLDPYTGSVALRHTPHRNNTPRRKVQPDLASPDVISSSTQEDKSLYQALLDPYTGSVALRHTPHRNNTPRRKVQPDLASPDVISSSTQEDKSLYQALLDPYTGSVALRHTPHRNNTPRRKVQPDLASPDVISSSTQEDKSLYQALLDPYTGSVALRHTPHRNNTPRRKVQPDLASPDVISSSTQEDKSLYQALLDPYTGSVALRHTPHRNNTPRRKVQPDLASPDVISSSTQEDKSLYQALLDPYTGSVALRHTPHRNNTPRRKVQPDLASPDVISSSTQEDKSLYQALLDPYTGSVALRHTPHRNNTPRRKVLPDLASPDVISSSTQEDKSLYQALLDPYTGSVALRHTPHRNNTPRRKVLPPPEDDDDCCSLDSLSGCSMESEDEPPPLAAPEPPSEDDNTKRSKSTNTASECSDPIPQYSAADEFRDERSWLSVPVQHSGGRVTCDMKVIEPFKRVVSHGGYSPDGAALIVFSACHLPDNARPDYRYVMDNLFLYVMWSLERLVTDEYVLVYLHGSAGRRRMPSFAWLHECYKLVDRRLRKSLKHLYLVHPTFWLKSFVIITKPFVSSKFFRKLTYVKSLNELLEKVPVEPNAIPDIVKQFDAQRR